MCKVTCVVCKICVTHYVVVYKTTCFDVGYKIRYVQLLLSTRLDV